MKPQRPEGDTHSPSPEPTTERVDLGNRYRKIGISAVAAAASFQRQQTADNSTGVTDPAASRDKAPPRR